MQKNVATEEGTSSSAAAELDLFRDTPVRLLGYANEVGEAFKPVAPRVLYYGSYATSLAYVLADAKHKYDADGDARHGVDALVWQLFASVILPGAVVNRIVAATAAATKRPLVPTAVGLASIPFIIKPIDELVHFCMDSTLRPWLHDDAD